MLITYVELIMPMVLDLLVLKSIVILLPVTIQNHYGDVIMSAMAS